MQKVKIPREVADALDHMKYMGLHNIIENVVNMLQYETTTTQLSDIRKHFKSDWRILAEALVNGYEVEETPEDKVRGLYTFWNNWTGNDGHYSSQTIASIIVDVVDALGITIKGVNDNGNS